MGAGIVEIVGPPGVGKSYVLKKLRVFRVRGTCNVLTGLLAVVLYYRKCRHSNVCYLYMAKHIYERTARSAAVKIVDFLFWVVLALVCRILSRVKTVFLDFGFVSALRCFGEGALSRVLARLVGSVNVMFVVGLPRSRLKALLYHTDTNKRISVKVKSLYLDLVQQPAYGK
jgi:hypothetical protein